MLLVVTPAEGMLKFLQVLSWIIIPVLSSAILITLFLHYRRKKKEPVENAETFDELLLATPEQVGYTNGNGEYVLFDHSPLIQEYKKRLSFHHARYSVLNKDFAAIRDKYHAMACFIQQKISISKTSIMQLNQHSLPEGMEEELNQLIQSHNREKEDLTTRLDQLNRSYQALEQDNLALQQQLTMITGTEEQKAGIAKQWRDEISALREKAGELEYLNDVVDEKKTQISFLQEQLEQRIKAQHQADRLREKSIAENNDIRMQLSESIEHNNSLKNQLLVLQDQLDRLQVVICGKDEELQDKQQAIAAQSDQLVYLDNLMQETKRQNEWLNAELADKKDLVNLLQQQLQGEESRVFSLEQKFHSHKQVMRKLHKELALHIEEESDQPPVIVMRTDFSSRENEELVIQ